MFSVVGIVADPIYGPIRIVLSDHTTLGRLSSTPGVAHVVPAFIHGGKTIHIWFLLNGTDVAIMTGEEATIRSNLIVEFQLTTDAL